MRYCRLAFIVVLLLVPAVLSARVPSLPTTLKTPVDIAASSLEYDKERSTYTARGGVELREGTRVLQAESVVYDEAAKTVHAEGEVVLRDGEDTVECRKLELNLETKMGTIEEGRIFVKEGEFYISGQKIEKVGEQSYVIEKGELTTCGWEKPAWKFTAKNVEVTIEGYAKAKDATFYIAGHKAGYLPWGIFPVKTERQSGILLPQFFISSRDGFVFRDAYFWAISQDKDATFYLDYIQDRGPKLGGELRYAIRDDFKGALFGSIINDQSYGDWRGQVRALHEQKLKYDMTVKLNLNYVSDFLYLRDFAYLKDATPVKEFALSSSEPASSFTDRAENQIKSDLFVEKPLPSSLLTVEGAYFKTLLKQSNANTLQYYPYISFFTEYIPFMSGKFFGDVPATFINFYRSQGSTFTRTRLEPALHYPLSWNGMNVLFSGALLENLYTGRSGPAESGGTDHREMLRFVADSNAQFMRSYYTDLLALKELQSIVKPILRYTYISNSSFRDVPAINPNDPLHLADRTYGANAITYALHHYLNSTTSEGLREVSFFEISQSYGVAGELHPSNLYQGYGERFSDVNMRFTFFLPQNISLINQTAFNIYGDGISLARTSANYELPKFFFINVGHNYTQNHSNQLLMDTGLKFKDFDFRYFLQYSFKDSTYVNTLYEIVYHPKCWSVTLGLVQTKRPDDTTVRLSFDLMGISTSKY